MLWKLAIGQNGRKKSHRSIIKMTEYGRYVLLNSNPLKLII